MQSTPLHSARCRRFVHMISYRPEGGETICSPPISVLLAADLRPSADGFAVRTCLVAGQLQAASVPIA